MRKLLVLFIALAAISVLTGCIRANPATAPRKADGVVANNEASFIGEDKAKEIVLAKAGLSAEEVSFDRIELDRDDGVWCYEVEFGKDRTEYDAEIKADDGTVLSWDVDSHDYFY